MNEQFSVPWAGCSGGNKRVSVDADGNVGLGHGSKGCEGCETRLQCSTATGVSFRLWVPAQPAPEPTDAYRRNAADLEVREAERKAEMAGFMDRAKAFLGMK